MKSLLAGHYQVVSYLGGGGFGQTFLAQDAHLPGSQLCVVKQLSPKTNNPETLRLAKRLFEREAGVLHQLGKHDQIPRLFAHFEQDHEFYLVQEYIEGHTLDQEIVSGQQMSQPAVTALLYDILGVLAFVHQQKVIHRDIKPSNLIRRNRDGRIVLIDFGAVKEVSQQAVNNPEAASTTIAVGSPGYMPGEQQAFKPRFSSDIYAVGMVCIYALTGLHPRQLPRDGQTDEFCLALVAEHCSINPEFAAILDKMVRYDYRQRYSDAVEALQALQEWGDRVSFQFPIAIGHPSTASSIEPILERTASLYPPLGQPFPETVPGQSNINLQELSTDLKRALEQLLASNIGPIAAVILDRSLTTALTPQDLVDQLVSCLPEQQQGSFREQAVRLLKNRIGSLWSVS